MRGGVTSINMSHWVHITVYGLLPFQWQINVTISSPNDVTLTGPGRIEAVLVCTGGGVVSE